MVKVITYGTYDFLHHGHIRLLERAKALGDYLIVGVTADDFDRKRGKINVQQSLAERIKAVRETGLADEIVIEEYEGQKIDDIRRLEVDIFTVGSDWTGKFDYLNEYCKVVYLERTAGVSSSEIRSGQRKLRLGLVGEASPLAKFAREAEYVNGVEIAGLCTRNRADMPDKLQQLATVTGDYARLLPEVDAVYLLSHPSLHAQQIRQALEQGKHVLCESPLALEKADCEALYALAEQRGCILQESIKTAYATAFNRLVLLLKSGVIGDIVAVDATCTSLRSIDFADAERMSYTWSSIYSWGPTALLPVFLLLGTQYTDISMVSKAAPGRDDFDLYTKIDFLYPGATATVKVAKGVKSEGSLVVSGTKGYAYVPAPWWKTDYFELRYENEADNRRYFYQLDGEGLRYEIAAFAKSVQHARNASNVPLEISAKIAEVMEAFHQRRSTQFRSIQ